MSANFHPAFKRAILRQVFAESRARKATLGNGIAAFGLGGNFDLLGPVTKHVGRQPKKLANAQNGPGPDAWYKVLKPDFERILKRLKAPVEWQAELPFMVNCVLMPGILDVGTWENGRVNFVLHKKGGKTITDANLPSALKFAHLFAKRPALFLRILFEIGLTIEKREKSPKVQAALVLTASSAAWDLTNSQISSMLKSSAKSVEHARAKARSSNTPK